MKKYFGTLLIVLVLGLGVSSNTMAYGITNCYSSGSVSGTSAVGGLVGSGGGTITNSYWDTETSGQPSSAGGTGKTTAEMKQQATFSGWNFDSIWGIVEDVHYPYLRDNPDPSLMVNPPTVTTQAVADITATTATGNGNITDLGSANPTQHGVCWSTSENPTTDSDKTEQGDVSATGPFTSSITGLSAETTYYVRAYATNSVGTSYGGQVSFTTQAQAPTSIGTVADGNWSSTSTWDGGVIPGASQGVTISHAVTFDTTGNAKDLTINSGGALTFSGANQLTIAGNASISGTMDVAGGSCSAAGTTTVNTNGILKVGGAGSYTANGSFDATSGSVTFTGAGTLNLAGTVGCSAFGAFTKNESTVNYSGADQSVDDIDYYSLTLSGSGTKTLCSNLTGDNDIDGNLTIASGVTLDVTSANNYGIDIAGNWSNSGTFTCQAGTVTFAGSGDSTLAPGGSSFYKLTLNKSASGEKLSPSADLTVSNALIITKGTFDLDTSGVNLSLGGALSIGVDGRWIKSSEARTVTFTGAGSTITDGSSPVQNLGHVKVD